MNLYVIKGLELWGDYGNILIHGWAEREGRNYPHGRLLLLRTGPFVPPISVPRSGAMVVTEEFRKKLETSGIENIAFRSVGKKKIVEFHWENWDRTALNPQVVAHPEPEDYVLSHPHSPAAAEKMGNLYEVMLPTAGFVKSQLQMGRDPPYDYFFDPSTWSGEEFFLARMGNPMARILMASEKTKAWFEQTAGDWLDFHKVTFGLPNK